MKDVKFKKGINTKWVILTLPFVLTACGGGGGGSSSDAPSTAKPSFSNQELLEMPSEELKVAFAAMVDEHYVGESQEASLNEANALDFASAAYGEDLKLLLSEKQVTGFEPIELGATSASVSLDDTLHSYSYALRQQDLSAKAASGGVSISNNQLNHLCRTGSSNSLRQFDEFGVGNVVTEYTDCEMNGTVVSGRIVVSYLDSEGTNVVYHYENLVTKEYIGTFSMNGWIEVQNAIEPNVTLNNYVIKNMDSGRSLKFEDYATTTIYANSNEQVSIQGSLSLSDSGSVSISTPQTLTKNWRTFIGGTINLIGENESLVSVEFQDSNIKLQVDSNIEGESALGIYLDDETLRTANYDGEQISFVASEELSLPPAAGNVRFITSDVNTLDEIEVESYGYSDPENQELTLSYQWLINNESVIETSNVLSAGTAKKGDSVSVRGRVSDGVNIVYTQFKSLTVGDAPAVITVSNIPVSVEQNASVQFSAQITDPDSEEPSLIPNLYFGPSGMTIDEQGNVSWQAETIEFGVDQNVHFQFADAEGLPVGDVQNVLVKGNPAKRPIVKSGLDLMTNSQDLIAADFDGDDVDELLLHDSKGKFYTAEYKDGFFQQDWMYPFALDTEHRIVTVLSGELDNDPTPELIVVTQKEIFVLDDLSSIARKVYSYETEYIYSAEYADLNNDDVNELVLSVSESSYSNYSSGEIHVINMGTFEVASTAAFQGNAGTIKVGNVDNDAYLEVVLKTGHVFDGQHLDNQWFYSDGFGNTNDVGDINGDGIDEILVYKSQGRILEVLDAQSRSIMASYTESGWSHSSCSIKALNLDEDSALEVVTSNCFSYNKLAILDYNQGFSNSYSFNTNLGSRLNIVGLGVIGDRTKDLVLHDISNNSLYMADISLDDPEIIDNRDHLPNFNKFIALGVSDLPPLNGEAAFLVPHASNSQTGQRLITMDAEGNIELSSRLSSGHSDGYGELVDYNSDGNVELLFFTQTYSGAVNLVDLDSYAEIWSSGEHSNNIRHVTAHDFNNDDVSEVIYSDNSQLIIRDTVAESILWTSPSNGSIKDFVVDDVDSDGDLDVVIYVSSRIYLWTNTENRFTNTATVNQECKRLLVGNVISKESKDILCLGYYGYSWSEYLQRSDRFSAVKYFNTSLEVIEEIAVTDQVIDITIKKGCKPGLCNLLVASTTRTSSHSNNNYYQDKYNVGLYSSKTGQKIWSSPDLVGVVPDRSLRYGKDNNSLVFGTNEAMYMTR
ncbi:hypothetical protein [Litoribacillus peritrichatus]|uniref:FG-GAP repeat protein n=1 Tax=Litoribacillus peritrichatus TaxID=718191 RepID=A0ABP7MM15_9GAMM